MEIIEDIKPRGIASAYVTAPFDEGKEALAKSGYEIISLEGNSRLRMQEGANAFVSKNGNWVREGAVYVPNKGKFLTKNSPIITNAKEAIDCHRRGEDFYLTDEQVEQALAGSVLLSVSSIPTNRFGDNEITIYAFGKNAKNYGEFLREAGIQEMPVDTTDMQEKSFVRPVWFRRLDNNSRSGLGCDNRNLHYGNNRVRGVNESAEGTQKFSEAYTLTQISKSLNQRGISGSLEKEILESLRH